MAVSHEGKFVILYLVLMFIGSCIYAVLAESIPLATVPEAKDEHKPEISEALDDLLKQQQVQLEKMEGLVKNFSELLARLESRFSEMRSVDAPKGDSVNVLQKIKVGTLEPSVKDEQGIGAVSAMPVTSFSTFWSESFQLVSAVKLGSNPTCINVLPNRDFEGFSTYIAVGDDGGRVVILARNGDVMVQFDTLSKSPVTAMVSFISLYKNESIVVTGHEDGAILMHRVWEEDSSGDEWNSIRMENIVRFDTPEEGGDGASAVTLLEVHHVGQKRYILSTGSNGMIQVFRDSGTIYGVAVPSSRPLAFLKQRLLFLTETGAGSLDLRTMKIREAGCEGLNSSTVKSYVFDASEKSKAYGFTSEGNVIHVLLLGDIMNFKCRIRSKKKFDMGEPVAFQTIKGYLLIGDENKIFVFNVSSQHYVRAGGPKFLFSAPYDGMVSSFLNQHPSVNDEEKRFVRQVIASNQERLVVFNLRGGYVAMYRSDLPVFKNEFNAMQWTSPVLFFILFLFGAWHFFAQKKDALTSWGPDDPFAAPVGSVSTGNVNGTGDRRAFAHSSRDDSDVADLGGGPSRRYVPPSQYSAGAVNSFRPSSADANAIATSVVEPNFLKNQEMKFRGSNLENSGFPKRRESIYGGSQVVDEIS